MGESSNLVLLSAGLDSAVNFLIALERGGVRLALTVDYGQRAALRERERARELCDAYGVEHAVLDATWLADFSQDALTSPHVSLPETGRAGVYDRSRTLENARAVWVPNRNGLLANIGACVAEASGSQWVVMGLNAEEGAVFSDNSPGFVREVNRALGYSTLTRVRLRSFTITWDKVGIMREAMARDLDFRLVWSCYNGEESMCGACESCTRLAAAARRTGASESVACLFGGEAT